jgi:hypothetical protein
MKLIPAAVADGAFVGVFELGRLLHGHPDAVICPQCEVAGCEVLVEAGQERLRRARRRALAPVPNGKGGVR